MRDDDRPARSAPRVKEHAWQSIRGWEVLLVIGTVVPTAFSVTSDAPPQQKLIMAGCLLPVLPLYLLFGRPAIVSYDRRRGTLYIVALVALFTPAGLLVQDSTFALFGLCPQCFMVFRAKGAIIAVIALNLSPTIRYVFLTPQPITFMMMITIIIFFSGIFGIWVEGITKQSEERAALIEQLENSRAEVAALSAERGAQTERERLAGEIHDTLAQGFTSIIMLIQAAEAQADPSRHLALAVQTARENLAEARLLVTTMSPAPLDGSTLDEALERLTDRLGEETGLSTGFEVSGRSRPLSAPIEVVLVRAVQEGLTNVRRHAAATSVTVSLCYREESVRLEVRDDGRGLDPGGSRGYGLRGMRTRVEQVGGTVAVTRPAGGGTSLEVVVPIGGLGGTAEQIGRDGTAARTPTIEQTGPAGPAGEVGRCST